MKLVGFVVPGRAALLLALVVGVAAGCGSKDSDGGTGGKGGHAGEGTGGTGGDGGTGGTAGEGGTGGTAGEGGTGGTAGEGGTGGTAGEGGTGGVVDPVARIAVDPDEAAVIERQSAQLSATVFDANDEELPGIEVIWASSDEDIAIVSAEGLVTAIRPGEVVISASVGDHEGTATINVTEAEVASLEFDAGSIDVPLHGSVPLVPKVLDAEGNELLGRFFSWSITDADVAGVDDAGVVTGLELGSATISASIGDVSAAIDVSVVLRFTEVSTRGTHTCALDLAGAAWCWGTNQYGQLGNGDDELSYSAVPTRVTAVPGLAFVSLAAGDDFTCALTGTGDVWCWGANRNLELGDGNEDLEGTFIPVLAQGLGYTAISAMSYGVCGLNVAGHAHCWGYSSDDYELGDPDVTWNTSTPVAVSAPADEEDPLAFRVLRHGEYHTCGLTTSDRLYCWGYNYSGRLGDGTEESRALPFEPLPGQTIFAFGLGLSHTCAVTSDETTWCWGSNWSGEVVGPPPTDEDGTGTILEPVERFDSSTFVPVAFGLGDDFSCALDAGGSVWCWGDGENGQAGRDGGVVYYEPGPIDGGLSFTSLSAGEDHTCAFASDEKVYCWGENRNGALGSGEEDNSALPVAVYGQ